MQKNQRIVYRSRNVIAVDFRGFGPDALYFIQGGLVWPVGTNYNKLYFLDFHRALLAHIERERHAGN